MCSIWNCLPTRYSLCIVLNYVYKYKCLENGPKLNRESGKKIQIENSSNSQRNETNRPYYFPKPLSDNLMRTLKAIPRESFKICHYFQFHKEVSISLNPQLPHTVSLHLRVFSFCNFITMNHYVS